MVLVGELLLDPLPALQVLDARMRCSRWIWGKKSMTHLLYKPGAFF
jgi:hypothetical protein